MSASYVICGILLGVAFSRWSEAYPQWLFLLLPAGMAFVAGLISELEMKDTRK